MKEKAVPEIKARQEAKLTPEALRELRGGFVRFLYGKLEKLQDEGARPEVLEKYVKQLEELESGGVTRQSEFLYYWETRFRDEKKLTFAESRQFRDFIFRGGEKYEPFRDMLDNDLEPWERDYLHSFFRGQVPDRINDRQFLAIFKKYLLAQLEEMMDLDNPNERREWWTKLNDGGRPGDLRGQASDRFVRICQDFRLTPDEIDALRKKSL